VSDQPYRVPVPLPDPDPPSAEDPPPADPYAPAWKELRTASIRFRVVIVVVLALFAIGVPLAMRFPETPWPWVWFISLFLAWLINLLLLPQLLCPHCGRPFFGEGRNDRYPWSINRCAKCGTKIGTPRSELTSHARNSDDIQRTGSEGRRPAAAADEDEVEAEIRADRGAP
jgi:hypothetical protein